jgi:hypothetical protein
METLAEPTYLAPFPPDVDLDAARVGADLLGYPLFEQGRNVARVLLARDGAGLPVYSSVGVLIPRRGTKTTSVWTVLLGLCATVPGFRVVTTAQNGTMASSKMREVMGILDQRGHGINGSGLLTTSWSSGRERITFANGSVIWCVKPQASAFRGEAADVMLFDEAGELDPEKSEDLLGGALPLLDTRPMGQAIIAGTPAKRRVGLLWSTLQEGRDGKPGVGIVDYSVRDDEELVLVDPEDPTVLTVNEDVLRRVHPGVGTLTTFEKIASRLEKMGQSMFEREYGCRFPFDTTTSAISPEAWEECRSADAPPPPPDRVGLAYDVAPDDSSAALVAAWRDDEGRAHVAVVDYRAGSGWLPQSTAKHALRRRAPVAHDTIGANQPVAEALARIRPTPRLQAKGLRQVMAASQVIAREIHDRTLVHYGQPSLDAAAAGATWRDVQNSGRLFGRKASTQDVSPLVAAALALTAYDDMPARTGGGMTFG